MSTTMRSVNIHEPATAFFKIRSYIARLDPAHRNTFIFATNRTAGRNIMMFTRPISELFSLVAVLALSVDQVQAAAVGPRNFHGMKRSCLAKGTPTPTPTPTPAVSMQSEEPSASDATSLHLQLKQAQVSHVVANDTAATSTIVSFQAPTSSPAPEINAGQGAHGAGMALNDKSGSNWSEWASSGLSWYYSWGATPLQSLQVPSSWEFVPMLWGKDATAFQAAKAKFSEQKVTHLLSFNEPDVGCCDKFFENLALNVSVSRSPPPTVGRTSRQLRVRPCTKLLSMILWPLSIRSVRQAFRTERLARNGCRSVPRWRIRVNIAEEVCRTGLLPAMARVTTTSCPSTFTVRT